MPDVIGRDVFKALALFATDLGLGLTAVGADFCHRLIPFGDRLQDFDGGLVSGPLCGVHLFGGQQHFLGGDRFGGRGEERRQNLPIGKAVGGLQFCRGSVKFPF